LRQLVQRSGQWNFLTTSINRGIHDHRLAMAFPQAD